MFQDHRRAGFAEEEPAALRRERRATPDAPGISGCQHAEAGEGGFKERVERGVGGDDQRPLACPAPQGQSRRVQGVQPRGTGGHGSGSRGQAEALAQQRSHRAGAQCDLEGLPGRQGRAAAEAGAGFQHDSDRTLAGAAEEHQAVGAGAGQRPPSHGQGQAQRAVEPGFAFQEAIVHRGAAFDAAARAHRLPRARPIRAGARHIQRREQFASGDRQGKLQHAAIIIN